MNIRKYNKAFQIGLQESMAYRWNVWLEVIALLVISFFAILVWRYISDGTGVEGFSEQELLSYLLLSGFLFTSIHIAGSGDAVNELIKDGGLTFDLIKPWRMPIVFFLWAMAQRVFMSIAAVIGYGLMALGFGIRFWELVTIRGVLLVLPLVIIAILLEHVLFHLLSSLAFWLDQTWGPRLLLRVAMEIGAGTLIPLSLMHPSVRGLFEWLPFRFFGDVPVRTLLGQTTLEQYLPLMAIGIIWLTGVTLLYWIVWSRGIRVYGAVGN
ncbi:MAG: ABC-2 family transporter protein [Candidatus Doudnabacteria bacterium]|nr:ABC-2 family transporter protein [Candidatus Doudnabacteria bacterium]